MAIDPDRATKTFRELRKSMSSMSRRPSPNRVHSLRTRIRRVEATIHALVPGENREKKCLQKFLKPIRKRAGKVRDMDVLIVFAASLSNKGDDSCLVQLIEYLSFERIRLARHLQHAFFARQKRVRQGLKRCSALIDRQSARQNKSHVENRKLSADALTTAYSIWAELSEWPRLNASNLHPFRLKIKELRYILELAEHENKRFVDALGDVKDAIGEWHDWSELSRIAAGVLKHGSRCPLMKQVRSNTKEKLENALAVSNAFRKQYQSDAVPRSQARSEPGNPQQAGGWQHVHLPRHVLAKH